MAGRQRTGAARPDAQRARAAGRVGQPHPAPAASAVVSGSVKRTVGPLTLEITRRSVPVLRTRPVAGLEAVGHLVGSERRRRRRAVTSSVGCRRGGCSVALGPVRGRSRTVGRIGDRRR